MSAIALVLEFLTLRRVRRRGRRRRIANSPLARWPLRPLLPRPALRLQLLHPSLQLLHPIQQHPLAFRQSRRRINLLLRAARIAFRIRLRAASSHPSPPSPDSSLGHRPRARIPGAPKLKIPATTNTPIHFKFLTNEPISLSLQRCSRTWTANATQRALTPHSPYRAHTRVGRASLSSAAHFVAFIR